MTIMIRRREPASTYAAQKRRVQRSRRRVHAIFNPPDTESPRSARCHRSSTELALAVSTTGEKDVDTSGYLPSRKDTPRHRSVPRNSHKSLARHTKRENDHQITEHREQDRPSTHSTGAQPTERGDLRRRSQSLALSRACVLRVRDRPRVAGNTSRD